MRFYTALINKQPEVLVGFEQGGTAYRLVPAQHNTQLCLIIEAVDEPCICRHLLARCRSTVHALRKINRIRTLAAKGLVRKTPCLLRMSIVVDAQADNVL